ncbi:protein hit [Anaerocolumna cellulosilytica]|uniref:Protein hit n=1 Tax=Anaerocolumna cellulosilytica TaxID=433286 RepID=A0A6S6QYH3_9FIRM|nr:HIT family protein [Anaerocolumna cellulosilytica]MBB5196195.1 histidine triad (HIT) family protein [Anaerocolumna cellulosilytica]BCJ92485.1 protein hit [Anaerocolumna cellulosilytica]
MSNNCIFCSIIGNEISSTTIYEDAVVKVITDISPANKGHAIIIPKKHFKDIFEMDEDTASHIFTIASKISKAMKEALNCDGINILQNNGEAAGQTVFHFHMHVIPRYLDDTVTISWKTGSYSQGEAEKVAENIRNKM